MFGDIIPLCPTMMVRKAPALTTLLATTRDLTHMPVPRTTSKVLTREADTVEANLTYISVPLTNDNMRTRRAGTGVTLTPHRCSNLPLKAATARACPAAFCLPIVPTDNPTPTRLLFLLSPMAACARRTTASGSPASRPPTLSGQHAARPATPTTPLRTPGPAMPRKARATRTGVTADSAPILLLAGILLANAFAV